MIARMESFTALTLPPPLARAIETLGYERMTPIQAESLPSILARRDVLGRARTGTGKTTAFGLGLLTALDPAAIRTQALVLCPTRELADQVAKSLRALARFVPNVKITTLTGGVSLRPHIASLEQHDPHVVVGTPGRVQELVRKKHLHLGGVSVLVLDEADRMLDMGFLDAIRELVGKTPRERQTLLYSATMPDEIRALAKSVQRDAVEVVADDVEATPAIEQRFVEVEAGTKLDVLIELVGDYESVLVFCNMRSTVDEVAAGLVERGVAALALHGELDQREREETLVRFANRSATVLVASDVAARGLDIAELPAVVSYDLATDPDAHLHRIGRTGRAGRTGVALALVTPREMPRARAIETAQGAARWSVAKPGARGAKSRPAAAAMATLAIDAGKTDKLRAGDILGALTGSAGLAGDEVGKIDIFPTRSYVAVRAGLIDRAMHRLREGKIKGRSFRVRKLR